MLPSHHSKGCALWNTRFHPIFFGVPTKNSDLLTKHWLLVKGLEINHQRNSYNLFPLFSDRTITITKDNGDNESHWKKSLLLKPVLRCLFSIHSFASYQSKLYLIDLITQSPILYILTHLNLLGCGTMSNAF